MTPRGRTGVEARQKARPQAESSYLPVGVLMVLLVPGIVILLDEAEVLLPLTLQGQLSPLHVCREITLQQENACQDTPPSLTTNHPLTPCQAAHEASGTETRELGKELSRDLAFPAIGLPQPLMPLLSLEQSSFMEFSFETE